MSVIDEVRLRISGPIPRKAPYAKGYRGRLYVPDDLKAWRRRIAQEFILRGGRKPAPGETVHVTYGYTFKRSHSDLDSITHAAQDALSKDALAVVDKEWWGRYLRLGFARSANAESTEIIVQYLQGGK